MRAAVGKLSTFGWLFGGILGLAVQTQSLGMSVAHAQYVEARVAAFGAPGYGYRAERWPRGERRFAIERAELRYERERLAEQRRLEQLRWQARREREWFGAPHRREHEFYRERVRDAELARASRFDHRAQVMRHGAWDHAGRGRF